MRQQLYACFTKSCRMRDQYISALKFRVFNTLTWSFQATNFFTLASTPELLDLWPMTLSVIIIVWLTVTWCHWVKIKSLTYLECFVCRPAFKVNTWLKNKFYITAREIHIFNVWQAILYHHYQYQIQLICIHKDFWECNPLLKRSGMSLPWGNMCERLKGGSSSVPETYSSTVHKRMRDGMKYLGQDSK